MLKITKALSLICIGSAIVWADIALGQDTATIEEIQVIGRRVNLVGDASSASEGLVSQEELSIRPLLRTGEVLETVPGMVATQHSGPGKANQYFLRGFNLDHGNDFATFVNTMPVNMRTHGHGQGYTDLNFIIPELLGEIAYQKGSYYPGVGDFSGTGAAHMRVIDHLDEHTVKIGTDTGSENWRRLLAYGMVETGETGSFIYGVEGEFSDGHWDDIDTNLKRKNLWLKQSWQMGDQSYSLMFMGYDNSWNSADQIPQRAVDQGIISEFGSLNTTSGGESSRYSLSGNWVYDGDYLVEANAYLIDYSLDLFADFTYFLDDPINGDQHNQVDDRKIYGWDVALTTEGSWGYIEARNTFGSQMRYDNIDRVGIYRTNARQRTGVFRIDAVKEWSTGLFLENQLQWTEQFRTVFGLRYDYFDFSVDTKEAEFVPSIAVNGGSANDSITTASLDLIYAFNDAYEAYASIGQGFHSNDARGTTITLDPVSGDSVDMVDPLVDTLGYEFGVRAFVSDKINASFALWSLEIDSELVFIGDSGSTEDTGVGSERKGLEFTAYWYLDDIWTLDFEYAYSDAKLVEKLDGSEVIPGALEQVISAGVNMKLSDKFYSNFRMRYFDEYPLDGGQTADASSIANLRLAYSVTSNMEITLDILNLFDSDDRDIQYVYESQLETEVAPQEDVHFHIFEPRTYHFNLSYRF